MKVNWIIIKFVVLIGLIGFLFGFAKQRNGNRKLTKTNVEFIDENEPFITLSAVNKLLIQNNDKVTSIGKETLVLNDMERRLLSNPMIRDAEVFISVEGVLGALIEQRNPIARVIASPDFYLDEDGEKMPLSSVYTARVPLITGSSKTSFTEVTRLLLEIEKDNFMKSSVVGLDVKRNGDVVLILRKHDFKVLFGKPNDIGRKFQNFKAFYTKAKEDSLITKYELVNLQFGNQVVATKK